jgi:rhodanese-related sulfurtransferase
VLPVIEPVETLGKQSVTLEELERLQESGDNVILLDVRTERSRDTSDTQAAGSVRIVPENVVLQAQRLKLPKEAWLIAYCA